MALRASGIIWRAYRLYRSTIWNRKIMSLKRLFAVAKRGAEPLELMHNSPAVVVSFGGARMVE